MPKIAYLILSEGITRDSGTKKLSLINTFDKVIVLNEKPGLTKTLNVTGRFLEVPKEKSFFEIRITPPSGKNASVSRFDGESDTENGIAELTSEMTVLVTEKGKYQVTATYNGKPLDDDGKYFLVVEGKN